MRKTKDSGVDWLGEVPHNWDVNRLKRVFRRVKRELTPGLGIVTAFRDGEVTLRSNRRSEGFTEADDYSNYQRIEPNDLAIHAMDAFAGAIGVCDSTGMCSPVLSVCSPLEGSEPRYMAYVLRIMATRGWIEALSRSIRERTSEFRWAEAGAQHVPIPPNDEQRRIADFLDRETAKIDALVAKQEQLITTLDERRKAVILRAVTQGIVEHRALLHSLYADFSNPKSGWPTVAVRSFMRFDRDEVGDSWSDTQLLSLTKQGVVVRDIDSGIGKYPASFEGYQRVEPDDIVFCLFDVEETPRTVGLVNQEGMITSAYTRALLDKKKVAPRYVEHLFCALDDDKRFRPFYNGLRNTIQKPTLLSTRISLPPLDEQRRIADFLDRETVRIDNLRAEATKMIAILAERRQALISAAVTGKLEVGV